MRRLTKRERVLLAVATGLSLLAMASGAGAQVGGASGIWYTTSASGGTPGGADTQVQYNDGGAFGGSSGLVWDDTLKRLTVSGYTAAASFGSELVTNGTFTGDATGWTLGAGGGAPDWAYAANNVTHGDGGGTTALQPSTPLTFASGSRYLVSVVLSA